MNTLISSAYDTDPNAERFAAVLKNHLPEWADDLRDYAWDAPIPPESEWEIEAEKLGDHLRSI